MYPNDRSRRWREFVVTLALSLIVAAGVFFFFMVVTQGLFLALLAALAGMAVVGCLHYFIWGRELAREVRHRDDYPPSPPHQP